MFFYGKLTKTIGGVDPGFTEDKMAKDKTVSIPVIHENITC